MVLKLCKGEISGEPAATTARFPVASREQIHGYQIDGDALVLSPNTWRLGQRLFLLFYHSKYNQAKIS